MNSLQVLLMEVATPAVDLGIGSTVALVALDDGTVDSSGATRHNGQDREKAGALRKDLAH